MLGACVVIVMGEIIRVGNGCILCIDGFWHEHESGHYSSAGAAVAAAADL